MANKNLNIGLTFNANTQQAKQQIRELKGALEGLTSSSLDKIGTDKFTSKVAKATSAVADLQGKLNAAINTDTGRLDLNKFTQSLQASGKTLKDYQQQFTALGSQGEKAFLQVSKAIANAEIPAQRTNAVIEKLWNSLKNVATWQLSSTILNSFTASLQEAYQYAQDLNKNLNDIRIVTGYGADEMDKFAVSANDAAKELSTTTNEYVKASLIYFQQGLSSQEVKKRTDATIKLANVTGESATTVSEWMTAIWNNFDNGSKSLEYYADVLTKLGAATASSSDEIAGGLEKFAAIAETVGLSYEYAATALATITAQTRQSEDVVGTGLRTIFSRLQSLSLGKTLDDGTTLTKYSEALKKVGVNIQTASGELRQMDNILDDLGARWQSLSESERVALANTVGGVRQYTNLISLMDNWDVFKNNLTMAKNSTGELNKQNEIYAESWEAANNRIKASMEDLYNSIVEDDVFITLTNGVADFIEILDNMIDSLGGLKTLLPGILAIMTKMFGDKIILGARSISTNYKEQLQTQQKNFAELRVKSAKQYNLGITATDTATKSEMVEATGKVREASFEAQALSITRELTAEEQNLINSLSVEIQRQNELMNIAAKKVEELQKVYQATEDNINKTKEDIENAEKKVNKHKSELQTLKDKKKLTNSLSEDEEKRLKILGKEEKKLKDLKKQLKDLEDSGSDIQLKAEQAQEQFDEMEKTTNEIAENGEKIVKDMSKPKLGESIMNLTQSLTSMAFALSSIFNLWDVLTDPDVSGWEKFTTILTTLIPLFISAKSAITSFGKVNTQTINESTGKLLVDTGAWIKNKFAIDKNKESRDENAKATDNSEKEIEEETDAIKENNIQTKINTELKKDNEGREYTDKKGKSKTVLDSLDKAKKTEIVGDEVVEKGAEQSAKLLTKLKGNLKAAGPWLKIAAAIAIVVTTIKLANDQLNAHNKRLEQAQKALSLANEEYEKITENVSKMKQTMSDYSESIKTMDTLVKGTTEYKEALIKANEQAMKLLQTNTDLKYSVKDGAIIISEESLDQAYQEKLNQQISANNTRIAAQMSVNEAQSNKLRVDQARSTTSLGDVGYGVGNTAITGVAGVGAGYLATSAGAALVAAATGAAVGSAVPIIGTIVGGLVGLIAGGITMAVQGAATEAEKDAIKVLEKAYEEDPTIASDKGKIEQALQGSGYEELADELAANSEELERTLSLNAEIRRQNELLCEQLSLNTAQLLELNNKGGKGYEQAAARGYLNKEVYTEANMGAAEGVINELFKGFNEDAATFMLDLKYGAGNYQLTGSGFWDDTINFKVKNEDGTWSDEKEIDEVALQKESSKTLLEKLATDSKYFNSLPTEIQKLLTEAGLASINPKDIEERSNKTGAEIGRVLENAGIKDQSVISQIIDDYAEAKETTDLSLISHEEAEKLQSFLNQIQDTNLKNLLKNSLEGRDEAIQNANIQASEGFSVSDYNSKNLSQTLSDAGIDKAAFGIYKETLAETYNMTEEFTERFAEARLETTYGIVSMGKALKNNLGTLKNASKSSIEYSKALTEVQKSLTHWLDTELDRETVEKLLENGTLKAATEGDIEAIKAVEKAGSDALIKTLNTANSGVTDNLQQMSDAIYNMNLQEGDSILEYMNKLSPQINQMLSDIQNGTLSAKDAVKALNSMNFEVTDDFELQLEALYKGNKDIKSIKWDSSLIKYVGINYDKDTAKKLFDDLDADRKRYQQINHELELCESNLDRISKANDRAFGQAKIAGLQAYRGELARNNLLLSQKLKEIQYWINQDAQKVIELGFTIDDSGNILNYKEVTDGLTGDALKNAQNAVSKLHETQSLWYSVQSKIADNNYKIEDTLLEEIDVTVNFEVDAAEFALGRIERALKRIEDKAFSAAEAISLMADQMEPNLKKIEAAEKGIEEIFKKNGLDGLSLEELNARLDAGQVSMNEADIKKLKEYYDTIEKTRDAVMELHQSMHDKLIAAVDEFSEKIKEQTNLLEHYNSILENHENIIGLIGKANLGISNDLLKQINQKQVEIARTQLDAATQTKDALANDLALAEQTLAQKRAEGADEETIRLWENTVNEIKEKANKAESEYFSALNASLEAAADAFKANVEMIAEEFGKAVSSVYGTIEKMREAFDRQQEISKKFLQDYEKTYEISKLNRNIANSIDNTKNLKAQQQLAGLAAELNAYSIEGREMSKIDLEYMQKKYDLMVAQIALEEAQNAKNQVRLTRDSSGNWGYVYTANEQATDKAAQSFEDKRYAMEQFMANTEVNLTQEMLTLQEEYQTKITELAEKYGKDSKEFKTESAKLAQQYTEDLDYIITQYTNLTDRGAADAREWGLQVAEDFRSTLLGSIYPTYGSFTALQNDTNIAVMKALSDLNREYDLFSQNQGEAMSAAGLSMDNYAEDVQNAYNTVTDGEQAVKDSIDALVKKHEEEMPKASQAVADWESAWDTYLKEIRNNEYWNQIGSQIDLLISKWSSFVSSVNGYKPPTITNNGTNSYDFHEVYKNINGKEYQKITKTDDPNTAYWIQTDIAGQNYGIADSGTATIDDSTFQDHVTKGEIVNDKVGKGYVRDTQQDQIINGVNYYAMRHVTDNGELSDEVVYVKSLNHLSDTGTVFDYRNSGITGLEMADEEKIYTIKTGGKISNNTVDQYSNQYWGEKIKIPYKTKVKNYQTEDTYYVFDDNTIIPQSYIAGYDYEDTGSAIKIMRSKEDLIKRQKKQNEEIVNATKSFKLNLDPITTKEDAPTETISIPTLTAYEYIETNPQWAWGGAHQWTFGLDSYDGVSLNWKNYPSSAQKSAEGFNNAIKNTTYKARQVAIGANGELFLNINNAGTGTSDGSWFSYNELKDHVKFFDTGGYTGDWGSEGKLAVLHQKEIILNAHDTENFLTAIQIVRSLSDKLERNALLASQGLGNITASSNLSLGGDTLEQHVTITAEFPNVVDHNEIEEAFNTLVNQASQYANR